MSDKETLTVATADATITRGRFNLRELKLEELASGTNTFFRQIGRVFEQTLDRVGRFQFETLEISAHISATGQLVLLGVGGEAGATRGVKPTSKRNAALQ